MLSVVKPTQEQWAVLEALGLTAPGVGVVLVSPDVQETLPPLPDAIEYDFGGEADLWVEVVASPRHYLFAALSKETEE